MQSRLGLVGVSLAAAGASLEVAASVDIEVVFSAFLDLRVGPMIFLEEEFELGDVCEKEDEN